MKSGTTVTDYLVQERERGVTIQSAVVSFEHENSKTKFNIFDTPGHADFVFEVERSLPAIDRSRVYHLFNKLIKKISKNKFCYKNHKKVIRFFFKGWAS